MWKILFLLIMAGLSGCVSTDVANRDPFESRLIALEKKALRSRSNEVQIAERERQEQMRLAQLDMELEMPNLSSGPDVISPVTPEVANSRRNKPPIGKISTN